MIFDNKQKLRVLHVTNKLRLKNLTKYVANKGINNIW